MNTYDGRARVFYQTVHKGYGAGFRIAHAQKSLSLVLKHYWCNNVIAEPPCCPVDRRILTIAGDRQPKWTDLDHMNDYRTKLGILRCAAQRDPVGPSLAEWELVNFN
jgi:hypothetical protein